MVSDRNIKKLADEIKFFIKYWKISGKSRDTIVLEFSEKKGKARFGV